MPISFAFTSVLLRVMEPDLEPNFLCVVFHLPEDWSAHRNLDA